MGGVEATLETITDVDDTTYVDPSVVENEEYSFRIVTISTTGTQFESAPVIGPIVPRISFYSLRDGSFQDGNWEVFSMNPDGTGVVNLTNHPSGDGRMGAFQIGRPAWSPDGRRIAFVSTRDYSFGDVVVMNADGSDQVNLTDNGQFNHNPSWSPDGNRIAFGSGRDGGAEIYVMDADGSNVTQLTDEPGDVPANWQPAWSPDGSRIAYAKATTGTASGFEIYMMNADGSNPVNLTPDSKWENLNHDWSPDGTRITWERWERDAETRLSEIWVMDADGSNKINLTNTADINDRHPDWSPDGSQIAFASHRDDNRDIYVMDADGSNEIRLTTNQSGRVSGLAAGGEVAALMTAAPQPLQIRHL